jgi:hypothetical protein
MFKVILGLTAALLLSGCATTKIADQHCEMAEALLATAVILNDRLGGSDRQSSEERHRLLHKIQAALYVVGECPGS